MQSKLPRLWSAPSKREGCSLTVKNRCSFYLGTLYIRLEKLFIILEGTMLVLSRSCFKFSKILALTNCHTAHQVSSGLLLLLSVLAKIVMFALLLFTVVKIKG